MLQIPKLKNPPPRFSPGFFGASSRTRFGVSRRTKCTSRTRFLFVFLSRYFCVFAPLGRARFFRVFLFFCATRTRLFSVFLRFTAFRGGGPAYLRRGFFRIFFVPQGRGFGFHDVPSVPLGQGFFRFFCASWTRFFLFFCVIWVHDVPIAPLGRCFFRFVFGFFFTSGTRFGLSQRTKCASRTRFI